MQILLPCAATRSLSAFSSSREIILDDNNKLYVSYLDYENRQKVLNEAIAMNIQLITESPAINEDQMELQYKITEI